MQVTHRPGPLHQVNKRHSKTLKSNSINEVKTKTPQAKVTKLSRQQRILQLQQNRSAKKDHTSALKRNVGCLHKAPLVIGWLDQVGESYQNLGTGLKNFKTISINDRSMYVESSQFRCKLINLNPNKLFECLDIIKRLDMLILLHDPNSIDIPNNDLLRTIRLHCLPTTIHLILGDTKHIGQAKRLIKAQFRDEKIMNAKRHDFSHVFQSIGNCKRLISKFKENRSVVETDYVNIVDDCLAFTGFVRHRRLSPNDLVHIPSYDDYTILKIEVLPDLGRDVVESLYPDKMKQESLDQENDLDPMEGEQTWPTADELATEAERRNTRRVLKKLPPGTSEYQEAWIPDEEELSDNLEEENDDEIEAESEYEMDDEDVTEDNQLDEMMIEEDEMEQQEVVKREIQFPDEIDTPADTAARVRFARYRGLKSFRTSPWDPQENLPPEYSRIFQFKNFQQTKKKIMSDIPDIGADPGLYVRVYVKDVPKEYHPMILQSNPNLVAILKHERKMTVMNLVIKALPEVETPIKAKEELLFIVGYRKFLAKPIFSSHTISSKYKSEKFLYNDRAMVATLFAPVTFPPAPVLVFRRRSNQYDMVASGSVLDSNPNRMVIKRIRLSGHPFKIHSKNAVIRFMFFNNEDVMYFKPVELVTRYNRRGHITEPLGTHGHMKCTFDKKIRSDDCVFMNLYKRVFPKWTYSPVYGL